MDHSSSGSPHTLRISRPVFLSTRLLVYFRVPRLFPGAPCAGSKPACVRSATISLIPRIGQRDSFARERGAMSASNPGIVKGPLLSRTHPCYEPPNLHRMKLKRVFDALGQAFQGSTPGHFNPGFFGQNHSPSGGDNNNNNNNNWNAHGNPHGAKRPRSND